MYKSQWKATKQNAKSQKRFNIIIMILTALAWLYIINQIAEQLTK